MRRPEVVAHQHHHRRTFTPPSRHHVTEAEIQLTWEWGGGGGDPSCGGMSTVSTSVGHRTMPNVDDAGTNLTYFGVFNRFGGALFFSLAFVDKRWPQEGTPHSAAQR